MKVPGASPGKKSKTIPVIHWKTTDDSTAVMFIAPKITPRLSGGETAVMAASEKTPLIPDATPTRKAARPPTHTPEPQWAAASRINQLRALKEHAFRIIPGSFSGRTRMPLVKIGPNIIPRLTRELQNRADGRDTPKAAANHETPHRAWKVTREAEDTPQRVWMDLSLGFFKI